MKLLNISRKTKLSDDCKIAFTLTDRSLGLLNPGNPRTLIFYTRWGIHTLFLKQPIDVLILNDQWKVVKMVTDLKPYSFLFYDPTYKIVIELPMGAIEKSKTHIGDKIFLA